MKSTYIDKWQMYKLVCLSKAILKDVFEGITNLVVSFVCIIQVFILLYSYTQIRDLEWEAQIMLVTIHNYSKSDSLMPF